MRLVLPLAAVVLAAAPAPGQERDRRGMSPVSTKKGDPKGSPFFVAEPSSARGLLGAKEARKEAR